MSLVAEVGVPQPARARVAGRPTVLRRFLRQRGAVLALAVLLTIVVLAVLAPWVSPYEPDASDISRQLEAPSAEHLLGTDDIGRDVLSRIFHGARLSLLASVLALSIAVAIGLPLGLLSGYLGGWWDGAVMRLTDALMAFPPLLLAVAIVGSLGADLTSAMVAIGLVYAPRFTRVIRASTLAAREETYVMAGRMIGCPAYRIVGRHILPNILSPFVVQVTLTMALALLAEASLSFIGLGVQLPQASLGSMLGRSFGYMSRSPVGVLAPGVVIMVMVLCLNVLGDGLRDSIGRETRRA